MARRRTTQKTSAPKWQPKEKASNDDERKPPTIMRELLQGKQVINRDFETTIEEFEKRIKLILRPGEMKARLEYYRKEAESKLPPPPRPEPLIKVKRNLHSPFLGEALEYMREFHRKHSANDLYGLPKACQDTINLVLTCPDVERIIQKTSDLGLKTRFQHLREARVLGFDVDPYINIDVVELYGTILKSFLPSPSSALRPTKRNMSHD